MVDIPTRPFKSRDSFVQWYHKNCASCAKNTKHGDIEFPLSASHFQCAHLTSIVFAVNHSEHLTAIKYNKVFTSMESACKLYK